MRANLQLFCACSVSLWLSSPCAWAQDTDVAATVQNLLKDFGPVSVTTQVMVPQQERVCSGPPGKLTIALIAGCGTFTVMVPQLQTNNSILGASNIGIVSSTPLKFGPQTETSLPSQLTQQGQSYYNCSATLTATETVSLQVSFARSASIAVSQSVTHGNSESINTAGDIDGFKLGATITITESKTSGSVDTSTYQQTVQRSQTSQIQLPPQKAIAAVLRTWPVTYVVPFSATVTVDADLSSNDKGYRRLSDIISADKRTFPVAGTFAVTDAADAQTIDYDIPFDQSMCPAGSTGVVSHSMSTTEFVNIINLHPPAEWLKKPN
jgi:hypothetical protein